MRLLKSYGIIVMSFLLCGSTLAQAQTQSTEQAAVSLATERFFAAYINEDIDEILKLWSQKSPEYAARKNAFTESFSKEDFSLNNLKITRVNVTGNKASLRVNADLQAKNRQTKQERSEKLIRTLYWIKELDDWKIWQYTFAIIELAETLVNAKDEATQQLLLADEAELATPELVSALGNKGSEATNQGKYDLAMKHFTLGLSLAEKIGDKNGMAGILHNIGNIHGNRGDFAKALDYYHRSLKLREETNHKVGVAYLFLNMGVILRRQGQMMQSLDYHQRALKLCEELEDTRGISACLSNMGGMYSNLGSYRQATDYYDRSLRLGEQLNDKAEIAYALKGLGIVGTRQGNYLQALAYFLRSLKLYEELNHKPSVTELLNLVGVVYDKQGNSLLAQDYYERTLRLWEELQDKRGISYALHNLGGVYYNQGNLVQAFEYYTRSHKLNEETNDTFGLAGSHNSLGLIYEERREYQQAADEYQRGLKLNEGLNDRKGIAISLRNLGLLAEKQNNYAQALELHQQSAKLYQDVGNTEGVGRSFTSIGQLYQTSDLKQAALARQAFAQAIQAIEDLRLRATGGETEQQSLFGQFVAAYHGLIQLFVEEESQAEALTTLERAKARVLLDVLQAGRVNIAKSLTAAERNEEEKSRMELVSLNLQIFREMQREMPAGERLKELNAQRSKIQREYDDVRTRLYARHAELRLQRGEIKPLALSETASLLPDQKTALLEFAVMEDQTLLFVLTKAGTGATPDLKVFTVSIKAKELIARAQKFRAIVGNPRIELGYRAEAKGLYDLLLKPAQTLLQGKTSIIIAPDGPLWELPFQSLITGTNRFLIEDAAVSYTPSLTYLRERYQKPAQSAATTQGVLALGINDFGVQTLAKNQAQLMGINDRIVNLQAAEPMVKAIGGLYKQQAKVLTGRDATEERFKAEAGNYKVLHLATHGLLNDRSPMYSQIVLAPPGEGAKEDGLLEAWELMNLDLKADLAILSACETARGRISNGEGVIGLMWALFVAGVPTTVVSQWSVNEFATQELMVEFHRQLRSPKPQSKAESLRQAMLKVMKTKEHPFNWAGFVLVGDGR